MVYKTKGLAGCLTRNENEEIDFDFFESKIAAALAQTRRTILKIRMTTAFRVFNGEGDGIGGLTIDYLRWFLPCELVQRRDLFDEASCV